MDTRQIRSIMQQKIGGGGFGVFPSDKLPAQINGPCALIVNFDPATMPGSHWVAIFINCQGVAEYFDSYGQPPTVTSIQTFLKGFHRCRFNKKRLQGPFSSVCGHYCIYFAIQRWKNVPMEDIVRKFSEDLDENDEMITEWINNNFELETETYDISFLVNQICHALK